MLSSDQQIPYHDPRAIDLWFQVVDWWQPDVIDYLGDTSDQFCFASFQEGKTSEFLNTLPVKTPEDKFLPYVLEQEKLTKDFYAETRKARPDAEIFSALGNHDIRVFKYADKKLPDILESLTPEALWDFKNLGIDYIHYDDVPKHRFGDIYVHHGVSALAESGASIKSDIGNFGVSLIRGHSHRMAAYYKSYELRNETIRGYEIGHMCKVDSDGFKYSQVHNWQQGFAIAHVENGVWPHIQLIEISPDYVCYVDGHKFSA
jgi:hypothetical protein